MVISLSGFTERDTFEISLGCLAVKQIVMRFAGGAAEWIPWIVMDELDQMLQYDCI